MEGILIFQGTHEVMLAEKILKRHGVILRLIPVPRSLTSDCGLAIRVDDTLREFILETLINVGNAPKEYYVKEGGVYLEQELPS